MIQKLELLASQTLKMSFFECAVVEIVYSDDKLRLHPHARDSEEKAK